ncbi:tRNA (adenosine(37)-N6)-dimethylallyltransferase MiaA [Dehalococcoides sp. THU3]|uniref:tRNA (adenosine(37)-N6)-dimethylallyltransferase MiaA n=1 Tax=Dehalococcoides TaxID=61434 RepID=UPI0005B5677A|nr:MULTISPECIES: tRNA (adenosine(37)-N6)-dimethylallyltransferase MiaA [Dehalococcoides]QYY58113.1 tRNA (adenosine(37)-N6)-dimethylallyltransferase MiaA [Dehalococcoides mccartyi]BAQ34576.1 tRNA dimethylallyltransferase [Dehalococcoides sp. UCH007]
MSIIDNTASAKASNSPVAPLLVILGNTGSGKSALALKLAKEIPAGIINADSRQIYSHMDIATAKPTLSEMLEIPHFLYSFIQPDQSFNLAEYQTLAYQAIDSLHNQTRLPILVGGSGQYLKAVLEGWSIPQIAPDETLRAALFEKAEKEGEEALFADLEEKDPQAASKIDSRNIRRVIRALEVIYKTGGKFSELQTKNPPPYRILKIGIHIPREELYRTVDLRIEKMLEQGLEAEVRFLLEKGYKANLPSMSGIGYRQIAKHIEGGISLAEAIEQMKYETHRLIRQQNTYFRLTDADIHWITLEESRSNNIIRLVRDFLAAEDKYEIH